LEASVEVAGAELEEAVELVPIELDGVLLASGWVLPVGAVLLPGVASGVELVAVEAVVELPGDALWSACMSLVSPVWLVLLLVAD